MKKSQRKFENVSEKTKRTMSHIKRKNTSIELVMRKALWQHGIHYRKNLKGLPGTPDIVITKYKIVIFCDSEFFHGKDWEILKSKLKKGNNPNYWIAKIEENIERDRQIDAELFGMGYTVIHFWGKDIIRHTDDCIKAIDEAIMEQKMSIMD